MRLDEATVKLGSQEIQNARFGNSDVYFDTDAREYFSRAGVTNIEARRQLNAFVRGVKALGLWSNMVCWPLRSSQNAGFGDTVHSLGGLGAFDGTRVNAPAWGVDGLTTTDDGTPAFGEDAQEYVSSSFFFQNAIRSAITVTKPAFDGLTDGRFFGPTTLSVDGYSLSGNYRALFGGSQAFGAGERVAGTWDFVGFGTGGDNWFGCNGSYTQSGSAASATQTVGFSPLGESGNSAVTTSAFTIALDGVQFSASLFAALRDLYKQTLGTGLGLP